nr:excinuclease ABC subunit UvrB [Candidatus Doudnabacteria bacterium]
KAIAGLLASLEAGNKHQTLLGVTGSGKTFSMANIVQQVQRPTLVMCHNKTLAAQLASEFQEFFPQNAVHYFVSYYDYYQPEAYIPRSDTYIEKETQINEEIDRLRNAATQSLLTRKDVLIVASVSCIYGLGNPGNYMDLSIQVSIGQSLKRDKFLRRLTDLQFHRNDFDLKRGTFRVQGDTMEIVLASEDTVIRLGFFGDELESIERRDLLTGETLEILKDVHIFPAKHFVASETMVHKAIDKIRTELGNRLQTLRTEGKVLEAARLEQRTNFDIEMLTNTGFVAGIENYSRHLDGRNAGDPPSTLIDYFPDDFLLFIDESHQTIPQVGGMYNGDRARKMNLVDYGFRLPSALDNRPLQFAEFEKKIDQVVYVSATPGPYELRKSLEENERVGLRAKGLVNTKPKNTPAPLSPKTLALSTVLEQIIRPTGLLDPTIEIKPIKNQVDDLLEQVTARVKQHERVLVTTLTKRMAEELTEYLKEAGVKVQYIHSEVDTMERLETLRDLRLGIYDVLVGINLLREGLDLPEVSLVCILDADKEGFLRSETAFMQIIGRAARHLHGHVVMYADRLTGSIERAINETNRRRKIQEQYNIAHGITPQTIIKAVADTRLAGSKVQETLAGGNTKEVDPTKLNKQELAFYLEELNNQMDLAAKSLEFELAAQLRDKIAEAKKLKKLTKK